MGSKLEELARAAREDANDLEAARTILCAMVEAKRAKIPAPEAWQQAFELVDRWLAVDDGGEREEYVNCPECDQILRNHEGPGNDKRPIKIACNGGTHILTYSRSQVTISADGIAVTQFFGRGHATEDPNG